MSRPEPSVAPEIHGAGSRIWFVSDVHLVDGDRAYLDQFLAFLRAAAAAPVDQVIVFGDLFEFWVGDRQGRQDFYRPLFDTIRSLIGAGTRVRLLHGNRDFLLGSIFEEAGAELLPEEILLELEGLRVHVSHGDQFCIHDLSYQRARVVFRSRPVFLASRLLPAWLGAFLARRYRGISERKKARKKMTTGNRFHTIADGVRAEFERGDHDLVLCGHIHHYAETPMAVAGRSRRVITTGAWEEIGPNYVAWEGGRLELRPFAAPRESPPD